VSRRCVEVKLLLRRFTGWRCFRRRRRFVSRQHVRLRRGFSQIRRDVGIDPTQRPIQRTGQQRAHGGMIPNIVAVAEAGVKHAAFAVHPHPRRGIRRALILGALHAGGVLDQEHVQIGREVFQRIPFFDRREVGGHRRHAGEFCVGGDEARRLLRAVADEFAADHFDVVVRLVAVVEKTLWHVSVAAEGVKRVRGAMNAKKAFAVGHRLEERGFAGGRHRRVAVASRVALHFRQIAGGVEKVGVELREVFLREQAAVFGKGELDVVLRAEGFEHGEGIAELGFAVGFDRVVLEARRLAEEEHFLFGRGRFSGKTRGDGNEKETRQSVTQ